MRQAYRGACFILTTKHAKSIAIAPAFNEKLGASMLEYEVDTDTLGAFSGEVERQGNALECARRKCEWALEALGEKADYFIASEGSFGPHPHIPFLPCNQEILYFIDRNRGFHLHLVHMTEKTNYQMKAIGSLEALHRFTASAQFPSHDLIVRPNDTKAPHLLFKGNDNEDMLREAFETSILHSADGLAWVETDMRAHCNPSRMQAIGELAAKMADRLATPCPACGTPGWGVLAPRQDCVATIAIRKPT